MKISILLPYKENFSPIYPGAVSLFVNDTVKISKYKKNITIFGNTQFNFCDANLLRNNQGRFFNAKKR